MAEEEQTFVVELPTGLGDLGVLNTNKNGVTLTAKESTESLTIVWTDIQSVDPVAGGFWSITTKDGKTLEIGVAPQDWSSVGEALQSWGAHVSGLPKMSTKPRTVDRASSIGTLLDRMANANIVEKPKHTDLNDILLQLQKMTGVMEGVRRWVFGLWWALVLVPATIAFFYFTS